MLSTYNSVALSLAKLYTCSFKVLSSSVAGVGKIICEKMNLTNFSFSRILGAFSKSKGHLQNLLGSHSTNAVETGQQVRFNNTRGGLNGFTDWRMIKDHRKRQTVIKYGGERIKLNTLHRNSILPKEIRDAAKLEVKNLPPDSNYIRLRQRCCVTSRPRGCVILWRFSRIHFRHLADYNKLAGVQRAIW